MITNEWEAVELLVNFEKFAKWDGEKFYLTIGTEYPKGTLTIMKFQNGKFYYHRKNERYWDMKEIAVNFEMLIDIFWGFRKAINQCIKEKVC